MRTQWASNTKDSTPAAVSASAAAHAAHLLACISKIILQAAALQEAALQMHHMFSVYIHGQALLADHDTGSISPHQGL
jgi:hypothetical protein